MADRKITDLTALAAGSQATGDLVTIVDVSEAAAADKNKKMTMENLFKGIPGDVGIGTSSPSTNLEINGGTNNNIVRIVSTDANANIEFADNTTTSGCQIGANGNNLKFGINGTESMRIDSSGFVGVGESSPDTKLHVTNNVNNSSTLGSNAAATLLVENSSASGFANIKLANASNANNHALVYGTTTSGSLRIMNNTAERMRIDSSGRLLVGGTNTYHANADDLVVQGTGQVGVTIASTSTGKSNLFFADSTSNPGTYACYFEYDHSLDALKIGQGNSERIRLDSAGRVMLGTTTAGVADAHQLTVASSSSTGITIRSGTSGNGNLFFSDGTSGDAQYDGFIQYQQSSQNLKFGTDSAERMRIDSSGNVGIGTTSPTSKFDVEVASNAGVNFTNVSTAPIIDFKANSVESAGRIRVNEASGGGVMQFATKTTGGTITERMRILSSGGITFNGDTAAANALDDYEEGTWTPVLGSTSGAFTSVTYSLQVGNYTKIGNRVFFECRLQKSAHTLGTAAGGLLVAGLPYTVGSPTGIGGNVALSNIDIPDAVVNLAVESRENSAQFYAGLYTRDNATFGNITPANLSSGASEIRASGFYYTS